MANDTKQSSGEAAEPMGTKPIAEHEWLKNLIGEWKTYAEMDMGPDEPKATSEGSETVSTLGGLWAFAHGKAPMPDGHPMEYVSTIGFDVTFKEYRSCWFASASSHLWTMRGQVSEDGRKLTLEGVGPDMATEDGTMKYRDVIEILGDGHRTLTSYGEERDGTWKPFMKVTYRREGG